MASIRSGYVTLYILSPTMALRSKMRTGEAVDEGARVSRIM